MKKMFGDVIRDRDQLPSLDSATKYPSIVTYHALGDKGRLTEVLNVNFSGNVITTEKVDGCFEENSPVMLANGEYRRICELQRGDMVLGFNGTDFSPTQVLAVLNKKQDKKWVKLHFDNGKATICTADHQFLTARGWVAAEQLEETDEIISPE